MVVNRTKKRRKFRGHRTHHGAHRKWRGGGSRGGRGAAGGHKHKWSFIVKYDKSHFGKHGFKRHGPDKKSIALDHIQAMIDHFIEMNFAEKQGGMIKINLVKAGYEKVLGNGEIRIPMEIHAKGFSKRAEEKIKEAGGKAVKI
jgi:large subunit ribosomal protein L15